MSKDNVVPGLMQSTTMLALNELKIIHDAPPGAGGELLSQEQKQELQAAFDKVARPCTMCNKLTVNWCNDCEETYKETLPNALVVRGRALCNDCEKEYFICDVCDEQNMWS